MRIALVHGFPGFSNLLGFQYFQGVADHLQQRFRDLAIVAPALGPFGFANMDHRAHLLANSLLDNFPGTEKTHIIAHSGGGIDARLVTGLPPEGLGLGSRVATVTTISSPHHGSSIAKNLSDPLGEIADFIPALKELTDAIRGFTPKNLASFAKRISPDPGVQYFSYAGSSPSGLFVASSVFIEGENDGWVSVESAKFGTFKEKVPANHLEEVGLDPAGSFNHLAFYERIVVDLGGTPR